MGFADQLRATNDSHIKEAEERKQREEAERPAQEKAETDARKKRDEELTSGAAAEEMMKYCREVLERYVKGRVLPNRLQRRSFDFMYRPAERKKNEAATDEWAKEQMERYCVDSVSDLPPYVRLELKQREWEQILWQEGLTGEQCEVLAEQLRTLAGKDGFRFTSKSERRRAKIPQQEGGTREVTFYSLSFVLDWSSGDENREITEEEISEIRLLCREHIEREEKNSPTSLTAARCPKLVRALGLKASDVFLAYDNTIFQSGKEGFAITKNGIVSIRKDGAVTRFPFQKLIRMDISTDFGLCLDNYKIPVLGDDTRQGLFYLLCDIQKVVWPD